MYTRLCSNASLEEGTDRHKNTNNGHSCFRLDNLKIFSQSASLDLSQK